MSAPRATEEAQPLTTEADRMPYPAAVLPAGLAHALSAVLCAETLPDPACAGLAPMWDAELPDEDERDRAHRLHAAARSCGSCPALVQCTALLSSVPNRWATGVWAGLLLDGRNPPRPVPAPPLHGADEDHEADTEPDRAGAA